LAHYIVELNEIEAKQIAHRAEARGYPSLLAYLRALVAADELVLNLRDDWQDADDNADVIESSLRESWHEAMTGKTLPIDQLWDALDDE
jgi:hypothetical protein